MGCRSLVKTILKIAVILAVCGGIGYAAYFPALAYWQDRNRIQFRTTSVIRGDLVAVVRATGTIKPVATVRVGAFVSGPIIKLHANFNDEVKEGQLLAEIDPRLFDANVARDQAGLAARKAEVAKVRARLQNATNDERRSIGLRTDNPEFISDSEIDQFRFNRQALEGESALADAAVLQAEAALNTSLANLNYTKIVSPTNGIVIDRKIDPGQTLASQFQTPELFVIAPSMHDEIHVFASVDEADIGLIRTAQEREEKVTFTVDAYRNEIFVGKIHQIRFSSIVTQGVVTYPVVVSAPNHELKLLPGMTANLSFQIEDRRNVLKVPNAALRYFPNRAHVRPEDRPLLDGVDAGGVASSPASKDPKNEESERRYRHVWVEDQGLLRAIRVETGISDYIYTEVVSGEIQEGGQLVTGEKS